MSAYSSDVLDLLADQATGDLSKEDRATLVTLLEGTIDESMEIAAAAAAVAMVGGDLEPMPNSLRDRLSEDASTFTHEDEEPPVVLLPREEPQGRPVVAVLGWLAAAACLAIALAAWWPTPSAPIDVQREAFIRTVADVSETAWEPWDAPEVTGVSGTVSWSEAEQRGYMVFNGLPVNDPTVGQYQLWIIDERGLEHPVTKQSERISGGVFDAEAGRTIIEIEPAIEARKVVAFAVTIEKPGGVWASTMERKVVIAPVK